MKCTKMIRIRHLRQLFILLFPFKLIYYTYNIDCSTNWLSHQIIENVTIEKGIQIKSAFDRYMILFHTTMAEKKNLWSNYESNLLIIISEVIKIWDLRWILLYKLFFFSILHYNKCNVLYQYSNVEYYHKRPQ